MMLSSSSAWLELVFACCVITVSLSEWRSVVASAVHDEDDTKDVIVIKDIDSARIQRNADQPSDVGICYGDDIYEDDIIADEWFTYTHGGMSQEINKRTVLSQKEHLLLRTNDDRSHVFRSKKSQRIRLRRSAREKQKTLVRVQRAATARKSRLWPDRVIPYEINAVFDNKTRDILLQSMRHWEQYTCLHFVPYTNQTGYVQFVSGDGCCSLVGFTGKKQLISIGHGCEDLGTVVHEIGHVLGFWHEQSRPDRDDHVTVVEENVAEIVQYNFLKYDHRVIDSLGQPYDYDSIMHYGSRTFSKNAQKTIIPKGENEIGQRRVLSVGDILQANLLYRCSRMIGACGGAIFKSDGHILSPYYPAPFAPNTTCDWSIGVEEGFALKLEFVDIDLPAVDQDGKCPGAYVELRDGLGELSPLIGRYCGHQKPNTVTIDSGNGWIRFKSGTRRYLDMAGFVIRFESVSLHTELTASSGVLKSMNYPFAFPPGTDTVWQIKLHEGFIVNLRIEELLIQRYTATGCRSDYLMILDGSSSQSRMITKLCQSQTRVGVASSGPNLRIEMHSGQPTVTKEVMDLFNEKPTRFHAKYSARDVNECRNNNGGCEQACLNMFGGFVCGCQYGYTVASNYRNCTDVNECETDNGGCSHLCINTEGAYHCACLDGFYLFPQNKTHCIDENECDDPERNGCVHHCHNTLGGYACSCTPGYILETDDKNCLDLPSCGGHFNDYEGSLLSPTVPEGNNHSLDCVWQISVEVGLSISLRFFVDYWSDSEFCHSYIDVQEGRGPTGEHIRICNNSEYADIYHTSSDHMWVHYHSQSPHEGVFQIDYYTRVKDNRTVKCGGVLNGTGTLESPGYPNVYPNKVNCVWKITGRSVRLFFENFDLEKEERCQFDFLDIRDGDRKEPASKHIGRFCGDITPPSEWESSTGELYIKFQSDATVQGRGFRAVFEVEQL